MIAFSSICMSCGIRQPIQMYCYSRYKCRLCSDSHPNSCPECPPTLMPQLSSLIFSILSRTLSNSSLVSLLKKELSNTVWPRMVTMNCKRMARRASWKARQPLAAIVACFSEPTLDRLFPTAVFRYCPREESHESNIYIICKCLTH